MTCLCHFMPGKAAQFIKCETSLPVLPRSASNSLLFLVVGFSLETLPRKEWWPSDLHHAVFSTSLAPLCRLHCMDWRIFPGILCIELLSIQLSGYYLLNTHACRISSGIFSQNKLCKLSRLVNLTL